MFDGAHLVDASIAVELPQQCLFDGVPANAVLGERAAAETGDMPAELQHRFLPLDHVVVGTGMTLG